MLIGLLSVEKILKNERSETAGELKDECEGIQSAFIPEMIEIGEIRRVVREHLSVGTVRPKDPVIHRSKRCKLLFSQAEILAKKSESNQILLIHILGALLENPNAVTTAALSSIGINPSLVKGRISSIAALWLASPGRYRLIKSGLIIDIETASIVNFALVHCGIPVISRLFVRNMGTSPSIPGILSISIPRFGHTLPVDIVSLPPGESTEVTQPRFGFDEFALAHHTERIKLPLSVTFNGESLKGKNIECWVLAHNECSWKDDPSHRLSIAAFVLSDHPAVKKLTVESCLNLDVDVDAAIVLEALYEYLSNKWMIAYRYEPPCWESGSQKIRLPHEVLFDFVNKKGIGTCIDLVLLFAASLEHMQYAPVIAIIDTSQGHHAIVGCRPRNSPKLDALSFNIGNIDRNIVWIDPVCCTRNSRYSRSFYRAKESAREMIKNENLLFMLSVNEARSEHQIRPLPFGDRPQVSAEVEKAIEKARLCVAEKRTRLSTISILIGLLKTEMTVTRKIFTDICGELDAKTDLLIQRLPADMHDQPTLNYLRVQDMAELFAKDENSPVIKERHLLVALLETPSRAFDNAIEWMGINRKDFKILISKMYGDSINSFRSSVFPGSDIEKGG